MMISPPALLLLLLLFLTSLWIDAFSLNRASIDLPTAAAVESGVVQEDEQAQRRKLGAQELLMLPRQYPPNPGHRLPHLPHIAVFVLSATPSLSALETAIQEAIRCHPLLRAHVQGTGQPERYLDGNQMVRWGDPDPLMFVCPPNTSPSIPTASDVLHVVDIPSSNPQALTESWQRRFSTDLDDPGTWLDTSKGPLWKMELHRLKNNGPSAIVISTNHVISDQGSMNVIFDQILSDIDKVETHGRILPPAVEQKMPLAIENSVLGIGHRWSDVNIKGLSLKTVKYGLEKAAESLKAPVLLPDSDAGKEDGGGLLTSLEVMAGVMPTNGSSRQRKTTIQFRTLSSQTAKALLEKCRTHQVTMSSALAAAVALTVSDFIDGGIPKENKSRNYKVLQSLDMRRFGQRLDQCETLALQAGSMDLMLGPLQDRSGEQLRSNPGMSSAVKCFWATAMDSHKQTQDFIDKGKPEEAVRLFDMGMSISELNQLIEKESRSSDSHGRAYSAGITNVGVYARQKAVRREGQTERELIQVSQMTS